ncbi:Hypothetical predicted protein [Cloeon dipterum]|uniref:Uncharacterized protein n=1 Tax=Cloeon dipterum TaxID=197152 RepID=A0A8S1E2C0_9INSE|nr:Hypothetical predicted protein [Cloeon dipterum]
MAETARLFRILLYGFLIISLLFEHQTAFSIKDVVGSRLNGPLPEKQNYEVSEHHTFTKIFVPRDKYFTDLLWVDMDTEKHAVTLSSEKFEKLASAHKAVIVNLSFGFKFFNEEIYKVALTTRGAIQSTENPHWIITPLFAQFDDKQQGTIKYLDDGTSLTVQWLNFQLELDYFCGEFSFQATVFQTGRVLFVYKEIPHDLKQIRTISPGYSGIFGTGYQENDGLLTFDFGYNLDVNDQEITDNTVLVIIPLPWCSHLTSCSSCSGALVQTGPDSSASCSWCAETERCYVKNDLPQELGSEYCNRKWVHSQIDCCYDKESYVEDPTKGWSGYILGVTALAGFTFSVYLLFFSETYSFIGN